MWLFLKICKRVFYVGLPSDPKKSIQAKRLIDGNGRKAQFHSENSKLVDKFLSMSISSEISVETDLELVVSIDKGYIDWTEDRVYRVHKTCPVQLIGTDWAVGLLAIGIWVDTNQDTDIDNRAVITSVKMLAVRLIFIPTMINCQQRLFMTSNREFTLNQIHHHSCIGACYAQCHDQP